MTAIGLARTFGKQIEAIAVYRPYLHYSVFNGIVNVLTEQAAKVFRFEEQNQLHEDRLPPEWRIERSDPVRLLRRIGDFVAGMTDRYAIRQYRDLVGPVELPEGF